MKAQVSFVSLVPFGKAAAVGRGRGEHGGSPVPEPELGAGSAVMVSQSLTLVASWP